MVLIPTLLTYILIFNKSFKEIKSQNMKYYEEFIQVFSNAVMKEIEVVRNCAVNFSMDTKYRGGVGGSDLFFEGTKKMSNNEYYFGEAVDNLTRYERNIDISPIGVYYYDTNVVLYDRRKGKVPNLSEWLFGMDEFSIGYDRLHHFLDAENYVETKILFTPIWHQENVYDAFLLVFVQH